MAPRRGKRFEPRPIYEALSFLAAGLLTLLVAAVYAGGPIADREVLLLVATVLSSVVVYYVRRPRAYLGNRAAIEDLLSAAAAALGSSYRLNIMKLQPHQDEAQRTFGFVCCVRMQDLHRYHGKLRLSTPGVGQAFMDQRVVHLGPAQMDPAVGDPYPKHVWSVNVEGPKGTRCVLNFDTSIELLDPAQADHISNAIAAIGKLIAKHNPSRLPFIE